MYNNLKVGYAVLHEYKVVIEVCSGCLTLEYYKEFKKKQGNDKNFNPNYDLIGLCKELVLDGLVSEVADYAQFMADNVNKITADRKVYVLAETANNHIYTKLFEKYQFMLPQEYHVCKSIEEIIKEIGRDIPVSLIKEIATELYKNPQYIY